MSAMITPSNRVVQAVARKASDEGILGVTETVALQIALEVLNHDNTIATFEQREANEQVRRLRQDGVCPTCGAEEQ